MDRGELYGLKFSEHFHVWHMSSHCFWASLLDCGHNEISGEMNWENPSYATLNHLSFFFFFFFEIKGTKRASVYFKLGASPHRPHGTLTALHLELNSQLWLHPHMAHDVKVLRLLTHLLHMHMPNPTHTPPTNFIIAQGARGVNSNMEPAATTKE